jgi:GNAT superfamily N-acetyltransferase
MSRAEAQMLQGWLVSEQWDEGEYDADVLYDIDTEGFWAILDDDGEVVGGLSIIASTDSIGSVSHFYIRPEARGFGWARRAIPTLVQIHGHRLHDRLTLTTFSWPAAVDASAPIGFNPLHEELRMVRPPGTAPEALESASIVDGRSMAEQDIIAFDAARTGRERAILWRRWLDLPGATTLVSLDGDGGIRALGTIRPTALGHRVGPLDAVNADAAREVLLGLLPHAHGTRVAMDVPAINSDAVDLALSLDFVEEFRTVRTVRGVVPDLPWHERYATVMLHLD